MGKNMWLESKEYLETELKKIRGDFEKIQREKNELKEHNIRLEHSNEQMENAIQDLHEQLEDIPPPPQFSLDSNPSLPKANLSTMSSSELSVKSDLENNFDTL